MFQQRDDLNTDADPRERQRMRVTRSWEALTTRCIKRFGASLAPTHTRTHMHAHTHIYTHTDTQIHTHTLTRTHTHAPARTHTQVRLRLMTTTLTGILRCNISQQNDKIRLKSSVSLDALSVILWRWRGRGKGWDFFCRTMIKQRKSPRCHKM